MDHNIILLMVKHFETTSPPYIYSISYISTEIYFGDITLLDAVCIVMIENK